MRGNIGKRDFGDGSIYEMKNGRYRVQLIIGRDPATGKYIRKTAVAETKTEARKKLRELHRKYKDILDAMNQVASGSIESAVTVGEWLEEYLQYYKRHEIKPKTYESYYGVVERYLKPELESIKIMHLTTSDVQGLINGMIDDGLSARTIRYAVTVLKGALNKAMEIELIEKNVAEKVTLPRREKHEPRILTLEEQKRFIKACNESERGLIFLVMLGTGMRRGEVLGLRNSDVDFIKKEVRVVQTVQRVKNFEAKEGENKTKLIVSTPKSETSERVIPVNDALLERLKTYQMDRIEKKEKAQKLGLYEDEYDLFFSTDFGTPIEPRNLERAFYSIIEKTGIEGMTMHGLRHTYATRLLVDLKVDPKTVQELLGHSDTSTTMNIYVHTSKKDKEEAAKLMENYFEQ